MEIAPGVEVNERIRFGKPVVKGTRVPVELILGKLAGGMGFQEVMREYEITLEDILAALDYASKVVGQEQIKVY
ncbi:DUF433 domain-containing protein [Dehalococcoidia bacterium]|nr:DUF433 domain-containing protein [Dehalococcoidia bacterium]MCL0064316.1 DUF433 domain-containing protein [Dehalococcoidia bacterium]MCL0069263.1 DUF433 domain-containing protein [Dehalococcoidia bacterium]MCL0070594.1 DUF433 domain-containing protein [Dehalococcoidia bacterium]MCL0081650.1 DUF433 domain-containing protein [Dehalococcoidia bacterium]